MKKLCFFLTVLLSGVLFAADTQSGTVTGHELIVRAKPGAHYDRIGSFRRGEKLTIVRIRDGWFEVLLPERFLAWVAEECLDGKGIVTRENCPVYAGPGVMFSSFATIARGTKLSLQGNDIVPGWKQVKLPAGVTGWVNGAFVKKDYAEEGATLASQAEENARKLKELQQKLEAAENAAAETAQKLAATEKVAAENAQRAAAAEKKAEENARKAEEAERLAQASREKEAATAAQQKQDATAAGETPAGKKEEETAGISSEWEKKIADLEKQCSDVREEREKLQKGNEILQKQLDASQLQVQKLQEELKNFPRSTTYSGVIVGLGSKATAAASHMLYDHQQHPVCFLSSRRIPLNQWMNIQVRLSGVVQKPEGWKLPLVIVTDIVSQ